MSKTYERFCCQLYNCTQFALMNECNFMMTSLCLPGLYILNTVSRLKVPVIWTAVISFVSGILTIFQEFVESFVLIQIMDLTGLFSVKREAGVMEMK
jgi:hypothetical protein